MSRILETLTREGFSTSIVEREDGVVVFTADCDVDADGCPRAYHPRDIGTDFLANAKNGSEWVGILTDSRGHPLVQQEGDPAPGYYISTTAYEWENQPKGTQRRYVDGDKVPFIVVPPCIINMTKGAVLGCVYMATNLHNGKKSFGMVADKGPRTKCGEASPAACRELGLSPNPKSGGTDDPIIEYQIFPGTPAAIGGLRIPLLRSNGLYLA